MYTSWAYTCVYDQVILHRVPTKFHFGVQPSFVAISVKPGFSNFVYNHVFLLQSSMFPAYWILMTSGETSESVMRVLVIQLRPGL